MVMRFVGGVGAAALWLAFPVVPLLAEDAYYHLSSFEPISGSTGGPDPFEWDLARCALVVGPLLGYGFLAGVTWGVADGAVRRWWALWSRRSVWVGLGPWLGLWSMLAIGLATSGVRWIVAACGWGPDDPSAPLWSPGPRAAEMAVLAGCAWVSLGWLPVAWAALRRARREGRLGPSWRWGLLVATVFLATLFGGYWGVVMTWRDHFFDPTNPS